jgi:hypothetical protein
VVRTGLDGGQNVHRLRRWQSARLGDGLAAKFGKANVFIDTNSLHAGQLFHEKRVTALAVSDVLIAVIRPRWMDLLKAKITSDERNYVRDYAGPDVSHYCCMIGRI